VTEKTQTANGEAPQPEARRDGFKMHAVALAYTLAQSRAKRLLQREMRRHAAAVAAGQRLNPPDWTLQLPDEDELEEIAGMLRGGHERGFEDGRQATVEKLRSGSWRPDWLQSAAKAARPEAKRKAKKK
jgi:hypothetical protein